MALLDGENAFGNAQYLDGIVVMNKERMKTLLDEAVQSGDLSKVIKVVISIIDILGPILDKIGPLLRLLHGESKRGN